jgi:hypothetical protein
MRTLITAAIAALLFSGTAIAHDDEVAISAVASGAGTLLLGGTYAQNRSAVWIVSDGRVYFCVSRSGPGAKCVEAELPSLLNLTE